MPKHWKAIQITGVAILAVALLATIVYRNFIHVDTHVVVQFQRDGGRVDADSDLIEFLGGSETPSTELATAAFCVNGGYWHQDVTLDLLAVVGSLDRLVRAGELVADGSYPVALVSAIEGPAVRSLSAAAVDIGEVPESVIDAYGRDRVLRYLAAVTEKPSREARERFLVFAASRNLWSQYVFLVDLDNRNRGAIRAFVDQPWMLISASEDITIGGTGDLVKITADMCEPLK